MFNSHQNSHIARLVIFSFLVALMPGTAALGRERARFAQKTEQEKKDKKAESKKDEKDKPKLSKEEKEYQKIKKFSLDLYLKDADFRNSCEDAYLKTEPGARTVPKVKF